MGRLQKTFIATLLVLTIATVVAVVLTDNQTNSFPGFTAHPKPASAAPPLVDQRPLQTAQTLAGLAETAEEKEFSQETLRLGDHEVDLAFAYQLRNVALHPPKLSPKAKALDSKVQQLESALEADQQNVDAAKARLAAAKTDQKQDLAQQQLDLVQAQMDLDQDSLDDSKQDLIRAGGDPHDTIQAEMDAHEAASHAANKNGAAGDAATAEARAAESTTARNAMAQITALRSLIKKRKMLQQALQESDDLQASLNKSHDALEAEVQKAQPQKANLTRQAAAVYAAGTAQADESNDATSAALAAVKQLSEDQKNMASFDQRAEAEQGIIAAYQGWIEYVKSRERVFRRGLLLCCLWIFGIALGVMLVENLLHRTFAGLAPERRALQSLRTVVNFATRAAGAGVVLLVLLGPPNQLGTVLALAGAGITVAMKDFIVGFFGWFILMGRNGIRAGDWVEINGVGGEVMEVGLLHTVLLEAGSLSNAGNATGRKVTFVNNFAIEGNYFNFSTSGQWLWDELEVFVPDSTDPFPVAEAIHQIVVKETAESANIAEHEWQRVSPSGANRPFSAVPSMSLRPSGVGVNVVVRYLTRVNERHEVRSRLYLAVVELLHRKNLPAPDETDAAKAEPLVLPAKTIEEK